MLAAVGFVVIDVPPHIERLDEVALLVEELDRSLEPAEQLDALRMIADETGLSKSAVQTASATLRRNELITTSRAHATAMPQHRVLRHWRVR